jgi:adenine phosphoribosyltransferase
VSAADEALQRRLRALVVDVPDFPSTGVVFRDITALVGDGGALRDAVTAMASPFAGDGIEVVAGIESRGFILGGAVAATLGAGFVPIRKQGKLPRATLSAEYSLEYGSAVVEVHADALAAGQRVLVVDDVLATGGTAAAAGSLVRALGGDVAGYSFLIELGALGGAAALGEARRASLLMY